MGYTFNTFERGTPSGNNAETCAMLHLLCYSSEADEIDAFAVDCFNDVTGLDIRCASLFDVQSKASSNVTPGAIGKDLVTLFKNSKSDFAQYFVSFTLFLGGVSKTVLDDPATTEFWYSSMTPAAQKSVRKHLVKECFSRTYINNSWITDENIDDFLCRVRFVVSKPSEIDYIKPLIRCSMAIAPSKRQLEGIFDEIRDAQSKLKNRKGIEDAIIDHPEEVVDYGRILRRRTIELLVLSRIINRDPIKDDVPNSFVPYLNKFPFEDEKYVIEDCKNYISLQMFDKNAKEAFWTLLDEIVTILDDDPQAELADVLDQLKDETRKDCTKLDRRSILYFIANVKDGMSK